MSEDRKEQGKERTDNSRASTPIPEDVSRVLSEVKGNGQTVTTEHGTVKFVNQKTGIEARKFYHGLLPREDIKSMLLQNGDYCVRTTEIKTGDDRQKCLSVKWNDIIHHYLLTPSASGTWSLDPQSLKAPQFSTFEGLIDFYIDRKEPFSPHHCRLFTPINRKPWEFRHHQIELEHKLGEGAFGEVYSGYVTTGRKQVRRKVAIKTLKCANVTKEKIEESMKEARMMRELNHPNIVHFYGVAAEEEPLMILMELVQGGSLDSYLMEKNEDISIEERSKMCVDAANGLAYLHEKGILHRDIAARNCLYANESVKISDFGMSRKGLEHQMNPQERVPVRWMAPEVFTSQKHTPAADVWAMGVLFWEIFNNGREPYTGWAGAQVKHEILQNNYRLEMPGWAPDTVKQVVSRIWIADPAARIKSKEIYRMLERLVPGTPKTDKSNPSTSVDNYRFLQTTGNDQFSSNADPADELGNKEDDSPKKRKKHKRREKTIANQADGGSRSQISRLSRRDAVSRESAISREHISHRDPVSREHISRRDKTVSREVNDGVVSRRQQLSRDLHSNRVSQYDDLSDHKSKSSGKKKKKHSRESRYSPSREQGRDRSERRDKADKKKKKRHGSSSDRDK